VYDGGAAIHHEELITLKMRKLFVVATFALTQMLAACGGADSPTVNSSSRNDAAAPAASPAAPDRADSPVGTAGDIGVVSSHGGTGAGASSSNAPTSGGDASAEKPSMATPALDARIEQAAAKANGPNASAADKKAAAAAYFERANTFRDAGNPRLYKFALADYRRGLRFDPTNTEARARMEEIVAIYQGMGKPVPTLGNEQ
jgi:hypothetical protein